jgi:predicted DNA-binding protein (UPF0251 family)
MSPRPARLRKISTPPVISGFRPYGGKASRGKMETLFLHLEEYEALRLCDHEHLNHQQASALMGVSRPTLTRIYARSLRKIAEAFVLGKQIIIEGGKIYFDNEWFTCRSCGCFFNNPFRSEPVNTCALCGGRDFINYSEGGNENEDI